MAGRGEAQTTIHVENSNQTLKLKHLLVNSLQLDVQHSLKLPAGGTADDFKKGSASMIRKHIGNAMIAI